MKRDIGIVLAVILILVVLISSFIYTRPKYVLDRTLAYDLPEEIEIEEFRRYGVLYWTNGFQAKIKVSHENPEEYLQLILDAYGEGGNLMPYEDFMTFSTSVFKDSDIVPTVEPNTNVYVSIIEFEDGSNIMHVISSANATDAYLYIYYYSS